MAGRHEKANRRHPRGKRATAGCAGLAAHFESSPLVFEAGWNFVRVVWGKQKPLPPYEDVPPDDERWEYLALEVGNKWDDLALYARPLAARRDPAGGEE